MPKRLRIGRLAAICVLSWSGLLGLLASAPAAAASSPLTWSAPVSVLSASFNGVSCASNSQCVVVDGAGKAVTSTDPAGGASAWTAARVDSSNVMNSISCPSTSLCVVVDNLGNVVIGESQVSGVGFAASSAAPGASSTWTVGFTTSASGALTSNTSTITLTGPTGTVFPATAGDYTVNGTTATAIVSGGTNTASFVVPVSVSDSTAVTVAASNVTNPSAGNDPASDFSVSTSSDLASANPATGIDFTYAADGSGSMTVSPTFVQEASTANALTFTYTAAPGGMSNGEVAVTVPGNWTVPSTSSGPGYTTASTGTVAISATQIQVTGVTLAGGNSMTITYGSGGNVTAPTGGTSLFSAYEKSTSTGTLTALSATPSVSLVAPDGGGSLSTTQTDATAGSKNFLTFIYQTPSVGGLSGGEVTVTVPAGWSTPSTTSGTAGYASASSGTLAVSGSTIEVTGLTLGAGASFSITYGGGTGAVATSTVGTSTFVTQEKSTGAGTLTAIAASPALSIYPPNGSGTMTVSPASVAPGSTGNTLTFTYKAATGGMNNGDVEIDVPSLWSTPNTSSGSAGYTTSSTGTMSVSAPAIEVTGVTLAGGATMTITYSDATAPGAGSYTFSASASSTNDGMGSLASSPGVVAAYAADGSGTMTVSPSSATAGSTGDTLTFTYKAATGGMSGGEVTIAVPTGWSAPGTTSGSAGYTAADSGTLAVSGRTIEVSGVTLSGGSALTITYGSGGGASGAVASSSTGSSSFTTEERSTGSGTLTALASSPSVNGFAADGSGTMTVSPAGVSAGSTGDTLTFTYTAATGGMSDGEVTIAVPTGWSAPGVTSGSAGYTTANTGTVAVSGRTIEVSGVTLSGISGSTLIVTYGSGGGSSGVTAPSTTGSATFTAQETSISSGALATLSSPPSLTIGNALAMTTSTLPAGTYGSSYSTPLSASGGQTPYTWTATGLPGGLSLTVSGSVYSITGTPAAAGSSAVALKATDAAGASVSSTLTLTVDKAATTTTVGANPNPASPGESVTYTATVGGTGNPAGTVDFEDGGAAIAGCSSRSISSGRATCAVTYTSSGSHSITAVYSGDGDFLSSTSTPLGQSVSNPANSVVLAATPASLPVDGSGTVEGTVYGASGTVPGARVTLSLSRGDGGTAGTLSSSSVTTDGSGAFSTGFSAPPDSGTVTVTASVYGSVYTGQTVVIVTPRNVTVEGTGAAESTGGCDTATATMGYTTETGCGAATFAVAQYGTSNPAATTAVSGAQEYFDAAVSTGNTLTSSTITECNAQSGDVIAWWNPTTSAWQDVSPAATMSGGCLVFTADASSTPSLSHLYGTVFVLVAPQAAASSAGAGGAAAILPDVEVSDIGPSSGPADGGTAVTITGSGFNSATGVEFGATAARSFTVQSDREILAMSPAGTGSVDITVVTPSGVSATSSADRFTYTAGGGTATPAATSPTATFSDVPPSFWAYQAIETLAGRGIVNGFPNGTFRPDADVTRAQFVKMLDLTLGMQPAGGGTPFGDVGPRSWYGPYVSAAYRAGIVMGVSPTEFDPGGPVTRGQMAVLLARALKLTGSRPLSFTDTGSIDAWALPGVEAAVAAGYLDGFPDGTFQPQGPTTRAQAAKVLALVLRNRS